MTCTHKGQVIIELVKSHTKSSMWLVIFSDIKFYIFPFVNFAGIHA